jgi:ribose transport system substrate-binding protein
MRGKVLALLGDNVLATSAVPAAAFRQQGKLLMPYVIATKETVGQIQPSQRW